jgi:arginine-tRNA-protein transferase
VDSVSQTFSHYPAWPAPVRARLVTVPQHACVYLAGRLSQVRAVMVGRLPPQVYHDLMNAGFRRSGCVVYQPICRGCRACVPLRVPVAKFRPSRSQRRCWRRNSDLFVGIESPPVPTDEKHDLYCRYLRDWHGKEPGLHEFSGDDFSQQSFEQFLYDSPVESIELSYRDAAGRLLAVGICDVCAPQSLSSVYHYFDPACAQRGLGTFGALREIAHAREARIEYYYLGYYVRGCASTDGVWREQR